MPGSNIWDGSKYASIQDILGFWICQGYIWFSIKRFIIDILKYSEYALGSEYARVLNMVGLHIVLNKILHYRYLTGFWIFLDYRICYGLNIQGLWICEGYTGFCVNCIRKTHVFFYIFCSECAKVWMYQESKYDIVTKGSYWNTPSYIVYSIAYSMDRVLNIPQFQNIPGFLIY